MDVVREFSSLQQEHFEDCAIIVQRMLTMPTHSPYNTSTFTIHTAAARKYKDWGFIRGALVAMRVAHALWYVWARV